MPLRSPSSKENIESRLSGGESPANPPRRSVLVAFFAGTIGLFLAVAPLAAGLATFLHPLAKRKPEKGEGKRLRVGTIDGVPSDGTPVQVPVIADLTDAWNREPNQPIGAVYLRKDPATGELSCFNAICPHAGCFVGYDEGRRVFQCPCHTSAFQLDGEVIQPSPSPRDMDALVIVKEKLAEGEIWIDFQNYYPGKPTREAKPG
jgi:menaquinol-cytochrome c reductase iron-sulfur subunit